VPFTPPVTPHKKRVRHHAKPKKKKKAVPVAVTTTPGGPKPEILQSGPGAFRSTAVSATDVSSRSSRDLLPLALAIALAASLMLVAVALTPPRVLPRPVGILLYERRDSLLYAGVATALSIGLGLLITLGAS
jgi:hypothetical protein